MCQSKKGREYIIKQKMVTIENIDIDLKLNEEEFIDPLILEN